MVDNTVMQSGRYKAYPDYKDSGVEWLGEIPSDWIATTLKRYCKVTDGSHHSPSVQSEGLPFVSVTDVGINNINFEDAKKITNEDFYRLVREGCKPSVGDVLLTKDGTIGRACIVEEEMPDFVILSSLGLLTPMQDLTESYLYYYLISGTNIDQMNSVIHGSALRRLTIKKINELVLITPKSKVEQLQIVNFLDHETAKIDTLIEKQKRLIELLTEKRQAVISHAVTKGLNPDAPMKDSGVEWLGEVPEHWELIYSKWVFRERNEKASNSDEMLTASQKYGVLPQKLFMELEQQRVVQVLTGHNILKHVEKKDFVISMRSFQGGLEYSSYSGAISSAYVPLEATMKVSYRYFKYLFKSKPYIQALQSTSNLVRDGQALRYSNFIMIDLPIFSYEEAESIGVFLDNEVTKIDNLILKAQQAIQLMQERRTALISAAVTGKIDVRDWVKPE